jgi:hypothetical protein
MGTWPPSLTPACKKKNLTDARCDLFFFLISPIWVPAQIGEIKKKNLIFLPCLSCYACWLISSQSQGLLGGLQSRRHKNSKRKRGQHRQDLERADGSVRIDPARSLRVSFSHPSFPVLFQTNCFCACWLTWMLSATSMPWRGALTPSR